MKSLGEKRVKHLGTAIGVTNRKKLFHPITAKSVSPKVVSTENIINEIGAMVSAAQTRTRATTSAAGIASLSANKKRKTPTNKPDDKTGKYGLNTPAHKVMPAQKVSWGSRPM